MTIPLVDLAPQHAETLDSALLAVAEVARGGRFVLGEPVLRFEKTLAALVGTRHAIGVASGTDALYLALVAAGVRVGDLVATTPLTFAATVEAIVRAGARPLFCDVEEATFGLDPAAVKRRLDRLSRAERARVTAIVPVHLFGRACDMKGLAEVARAHELRIVEDVAQALGGTTGGRALGSFGAAAALSFFPTKNLGAWGDGGAVVTGDDAMAARVRRLRVHGHERGHFVEVGANSRLDAIQAAVLEVKSTRLAPWNRARTEAAARYRELVAIPELSFQDAGEPGEYVAHQFVVRTKRRDELLAHLAARGIETRAYYATPLHREPCFAALDSPDVPVAERLSRELLALPMFYGITKEQQDEVAAAVRSFFGAR